MKRERRSLLNKVTSLILAGAMLFSVAVVSAPDPVSASVHSMPGKGGTVAIADAASSVIAGDYNWISYKAPNDGYLQIRFVNATRIPEIGYSVGEVQMFNTAKSQPLSSAFVYDTSSNVAGFSSECYGVKKGRTYQIRIKSVGGVNVVGKFKKVKDKSGTKKKKALNLKRGRSTVGVIAAGTSNSHWYKFTLKKPQKMNVNLTPYLTGSVNLSVKGPGIYPYAKTVTCRTDDGKTIWLNNYSKKYQVRWPKIRTGTYYIEVKPANKLVNGYYKLSWK